MTTVEDDIRRVLSGTDPRSNSAEVEEPTAPPAARRCANLPLIP